MRIYITVAEQKSLILRHRFKGLPWNDSICSAQDDDVIDAGAQSTLVIVKAASDLLLVCRLYGIGESQPFPPSTEVFLKPTSSLYFGRLETF